MKYLRPFGLIVISLSLCYTLPSDVTTARYNSDVQNFTERIHFPENKSRPSENDTGRKLSANKKNEQLLLKDFIKNNLEGLNLPNKSLEIITVHKVPQNKSISVTTEKSSKYKIKLVTAKNPIFFEDEKSTELTPIELFYKYDVDSKTNKTSVSNFVKLHSVTLNDSDDNNNSNTIKDKVSENSVKLQPNISNFIKEHDTSTVHPVNTKFNPDSNKDDQNTYSVTNSSTGVNFQRTTNIETTLYSTTSIPKSIASKKSNTLTKSKQTLVRQHTNKPIILTINTNKNPTRNKPSNKNAANNQHLSKTKQVTRNPLKTSATISTTKPPFRIRLNKITTTTKRPKRVSTFPPRKILLTKAPNRRVTSSRSTVKPKRRQPTRKSNTKRKPIRKIVKTPSDRPSISDFKQTWADVPIPNPMPVISTNSPPFSMLDLSNAGELDDSIFVDAADSDDIPDQNPLNTFTLDMIPDATKQGGGGTGCPTVHIASSVLNPQLRQECSDLNLVINSHIHQNSVTDRTPLADAVDTYDSDSEVVEAPAEGVAQDAPLESPASQAAASPASSAGGTGGSGGSGGNGGGQNPLSGLGFPDFKGLMDALGWLWNALGGVFQFLSNPYLYIVPITLFFLLGFLLVLALFPWWIPLLLLLLGIKSSKKTNNVTYYKHVHKPIHHPDGWFWNHQTKTWQNVADYLHHRRFGVDEQSNISNIPAAIDNFAKRYEQINNNWKWRRRSR